MNSEALSALLFTDWQSDDIDRRVLSLLADDSWTIARPGERSVPACVGRPINGEAWYLSDLYRDIAVSDLVVFDVAYCSPALGDLLRHCVEAVSSQARLNYMGYHWYLTRCADACLDLDSLFNSKCNKFITSCNYHID